MARQLNRRHRGSSDSNARPSAAAAAVSVSVALLALGGPPFAATDAFAPIANSVRHRSSFVAPSSIGSDDSSSRTRTNRVVTVIRHMSDVGDRPPPGGGSGGGSGGGGKNRRMGDFLGRDSNGESDDLRGARERIAEDSLPISFGFERAEGEGEGEAEGGGGDDADTVADANDDGPSGIGVDVEADKGGDLLFQSNPGDPSSAATALDLKDNPYLEVVSRLSPSELISKFTTTAHPRVQDAVRSTILGLIGNLPKMAFDTTTVTTGERLASLMFQLQMTGYMFRNAEYRLSLAQSLGMDNLPSMGGMAKNGYLLEGTLDRHRDDDEEDEDGEEGDDPSPIRLDGKVRGKIKVKYGRRSDDGKGDEGGGDGDGNTEDADGDAPSSSSSSDGPPASYPNLEIEVDAAAYMSELRSEVSRLKDELSTSRKSKDDAVRKDLLLYIRTMPRDELQELTGTMSPDVLAAMKGLVNVVMAGIGEGKVEADTVTEQSGEAMAQLCMWQLVVGYNLRELEVREEMKAALGKFEGGEDDDGRVWLGEGH